MSHTARPIAPEALAEAVAALVIERPGLLRVAVDGPRWAGAHDLAAALLAPIRLAGRSVGLVLAESFWRDASLRFEHGREDPDTFAEWLDSAALRREVLDRAVGLSSYLPSLRDPITNRATRRPPVPLPGDGVVIVVGPFLLGRDLPFDTSVHLALTPGARSRRVPIDERWTLPAFDCLRRGGAPGRGRRHRRPLRRPAPPGALRNPGSRHRTVVARPPPHDQVADSHDERLPPDRPAGVGCRRLHRRTVFIGGPSS